MHLSYINDRTDKRDRSVSVVWSVRTLETLPHSAAGEDSRFDSGSSKISAQGLAIMRMKTQSCIIRPVLIVGLVCVLALSAGPSCSFAIAVDKTRRLLESSSDGSRFQLLHWSHPDAVHHIAGLSFTEKLQLAVQNSKERVVALTRKMQGLPESLEAELSSAPAPAPAYEVVAPTPGSPTSTFVSQSFNLLGEYAMEIVIGTPPRKFSGIADTGSDLVWLQCKGCDFCRPQADPLYDPSKSSTYTAMSCTDPLCGPVESVCTTNKTCSYAYAYGSGETDGIMSYESLTLTTTTGRNSTADRFAFGCDFETYLDTLGADGLVGLGQGPLSFTTQLASLYGDKFSYCLVSITDSNRSTSPLLFGDDAVPSGPLQFTPILINPNATYETFYYIGLKGMKVNGVSLDIPSGAFDILPDGTGGVISDSGTFISLLTPDAYAPLLAKMQSETKYPPIPFSNLTLLDLCYDLPNVTTPVFPNLTMVFDGFSLDLPTENVFLGGITLGALVNSSYSHTYCLAFADSGFPVSIFGNTQQQNFQILHDRKAKQFGFAKVKCDTLT